MGNAERVAVNENNLDDGPVMEVNEESRHMVNETIDQGVEILEQMEGLKNEMKQLIEQANALGIDKKALKKVIGLVHKDKVSNNKEEEDKLNEIIRMSGRDFV